MNSLKYAQTTGMLPPTLNKINIKILIIINQFSVLKIKTSNYPIPLKKRKTSNMTNDRLKPDKMANNALNNNA